jgi:putative lipoprotein
MNWAFRIIFPLILIFLFSSVASAKSEKLDNWFARDKYEHFALSAAYSAGTTFILHRHFELSNERSRVVGFTFTVSLGALKEGIDAKTRTGTPSFKDFVWDVAGALTGILAVSLTQ